MEMSPDAPGRGDGSERADHELAGGERGVGDGEGAAAVTAAAPQEDVEVEHARAPAPAGAAAEAAFECLQGAQHGGRVERAFGDGGGVGEVAAGAAARPVEENGGGVEQAEFTVEFGNGGGDDAGGTAVMSVRAVGADGDGVEVLHYWVALSLRAERSNLSRATKLDCFVATLLAMTGECLFNPRLRPPCRR